MFYISYGSQLLAPVFCSLIRRSSSLQDKYDDRFCSYCDSAHSQSTRSFCWQEALLKGEISSAAETLRRFLIATVNLWPNQTTTRTAWKPYYYSLLSPLLWFQVITSEFLWQIFQNFLLLFSLHFILLQEWLNSHWNTFCIALPPQDPLSVIKSTRLHFIFWQIQEKQPNSAALTVFRATPKSSGIRDQKTDSCSSWDTCTWTAVLLKLEWRWRWKEAQEQAKPAL